MRTAPAETSLAQRVEHIAARARAKTSATAPAPTEHAIPLRPVEQEQLSLFDSAPIRAGNEFPSVLSRLPVFPPCTRKRQRAMLDNDNALPFDTPFGRGRRHGPPVTIEDEDVLIALLRLRQQRITGDPTRFPIPLRPACPGDQETAHITRCTVSRLIDEMGLSRGGKNYRDIVASIKRLAAVSLELEFHRPYLNDKYLGERVGTNLKLIDVIWREHHDEDCTLEVQFFPVVARWLEQHATYIDWSVRRQLTSPIARALHRFLSSQGRYFKREIGRVAEVIGYDMPTKVVRRRFAEALEDMKSIGWVSEYQITGTGRNSPITMEIWRKA